MQVSGTCVGLTPSQWADQSHKRTYLIQQFLKQIFCNNISFLNSDL